jgi:hypothetical protein
MKRLAVILLSLLMSACSTIKPNSPAVLSPFGDGSQWVLREDMVFELTSDNDITATIRVPKGFVTDLASTPRRVWALYPPFGKYLSAAILHDYLYWTQMCERDQADKIFYHAMKQSQVNLATQAVFLMILKLQGLPAWQQNQQEKTSGLVRVVPNDYLDPSEPHFTRQTRWPDLREALLTQGVTEQFPQTSQSTQVTCTVFSGENYEKPALFTQF